MSEATSISVIIWDGSGAEVGLIKLPTDVPVNQLVGVLAQRLSLPQTNSTGQRISYKLNHQAKARQLLADETLAAAGVEDGAVLRILREILAG